MGNKQTKPSTHRHRAHSHAHHHHLPLPSPHVLFPFSPVLAANHASSTGGAEEGPFWPALVRRISSTANVTAAASASAAATPAGNDGADADQATSSSSVVEEGRWDVAQLTDLLVWICRRLMPSMASETPEKNKRRISQDADVQDKKKENVGDNSKADAEGDGRDSVEIGGSTFGGLVSFLTSDLTEAERAQFFSLTLPFVFAQVLRLPELFGTSRSSGTPLQRLLPGENKSVDLTETQLCALVCAQFLCCIPDQHALALRPEDTSRMALSDSGLSEAASYLLGEECLCVVRFPCPNFVGPMSFLFCGRATKKVLPHQAAKLHCLLSYFSRRQAFTGVDRTLSFRRQCYSGPVAWAESTERLTLIQMAASGDTDAAPPGIEDAIDCVQVDFANRSIGGGVLQSGCVQEEIRFAVSPELLPSLIFCSFLRHHEALIVSNTAVLCEYQGYGTTFKFVGPKKEIHPGTMIAIDALDYRMASQHLQFETAAIVRELQKAFVGFSEPPECHVVCAPAADSVHEISSARNIESRGDSSAKGAAAKTQKKAPRRDKKAAKPDVSGSEGTQTSEGSAESNSNSDSELCCDDSRPGFWSVTEPLRPVATGNWGAGAFAGSAELKAVVQWLAASQAYRDMHYYPYNREGLGPALLDLQCVALELGANVGNVFRALLCVCERAEIATALVSGSSQARDEFPLLKAVCAELRLHKEQASTKAKVVSTSAGSQKDQ